MATKKIQSALISVFHKDGLAPIVNKLHKLNVNLYSTGGTEKFIKELGIPVTPVESLTSYPSILDGRVKTLHPKVFGGILSRRDNENDKKQLAEYNIPEMDLVIVDLYPFEKTIETGGTTQEIIEKIDIGGISLIRAAAKNYHDVLCISSMEQYEPFLHLLNESKGDFTIEQRQHHAALTFQISSHYDTAIFNYFNQKKLNTLKISENSGKELRYGENPHQKGFFYGDFDKLFTILNGKELSYNNLLDVDAAVNVMSEFINDKPTFAILKHNNCCGLAQRETVSQAYTDALAGDPTSAFGGILISNIEIDKESAEKINTLFCEVIIAPSYTKDAIAVLKSKKNRRILEWNVSELPTNTVRTCLNGFLVQDKDSITDNKEMLEYVTTLKPSAKEIDDLLFASKICKHTKSNTIVLVKNNQLLASGTGQTSRIDALNQSIAKAKHFGFDLNGAVMASDAFFPFPDCVEIAHKAGIKSVIQPGGSIKDQLSIDYCNTNKVSMVFSNTRHFKH